MLKIYKKYTLSKMGHKRINKIKIRHTHKHALIGGSRDDPNLSIDKNQILNPNNDQKTRINLQQTYNTLLNKILVSLIPPIQNRLSVAKNIFDTPITITNDMFPEYIILYAFIILYTFITYNFKIDTAPNNINILKSIIDETSCNQSSFTQELKDYINTFIVQYIYEKIHNLDINNNLSDNIVDNISYYNTLRDYLGCFFNSDKQLVSSVNVFQYFIITYQDNGSSKIDTITIFNSPLIADKANKDNVIKQPNDITSINISTSKHTMFFEPQQGAGCGRHALNNILGGKYFIAGNTSDDDKTIKEKYDKMQDHTHKLSTHTPFNLITYCKYLQIKTLGNSTTEYVEVINKKSITHNNGYPNCDYTSENYDITLLISAMQLFGYNISPYNDKELYNIVSPTFIGFIVGTGGHWYVHKKIDKRNAHDHPLFVYIDSKDTSDPNRKTRTFNEILEYENTKNHMQMLYTVINTQPRK